MDISIIVPCFNEIENVKLLQDDLFPIVKELAATYSFEIIFIDDGSTDGTFDKLKDTFEGFYDPRILFRFERHPANRGLGAAIRTGFSAAGGQVIMTVDSDGTYKYCGIPSLLACLAPGIDIVTASPYHPQGGVEGVPSSRLFLSKSSALIYRLLVDRKIYTYTSLFRVYRRTVTKNVTFSSDGFLAGTELMVKAMLNGYHVSEYPCVLYRRIYGVSKAKIIQTIKAHLAFQARVLLHKLHIHSLDLNQKVLIGD